MSDATKKIKAFTLHEMLVVLLITVLVVGMAYSVLRLVQTQMNGISSNYEEMTEVRLLKQRLWIDFNQYDRVWYNAANRELLLCNEISEVEYQFQKELVLKGQDTFHLKTKELLAYFEVGIINEGEIDAIDLYVGGGNGTRLFVFKRNSATSYINR
ncbi:hypothetical protein [Allomuricauda sp. F6463D]|uniref:hypothetical protein n=1 Tax=Allomuricauda sp. F6463D TaxID=2926409 RepID=UPI001FF1A86F|nr:hypothetical protein [Muricauda sp. F6463D]MCK0160126.1 hypothetical protein [Muricauda sp. F6463D]